MNKAQREVAEYLLDKEERIIKQLERQYKQAMEDVEMDIRIMLMDEQTPSRIHRVEYQKRLKAQIESTLENLHRNEYKTINQFLQDSYKDSFVGTMYDMHSQGVPVIVPIDQNAAVKAIQLDTQLSDRKIHPNANGEHVTLYESLGVDVNNLKEVIRLEITRGLATNMLPENIARNIANLTKAPLSRAKTIARTEAHRIQEASAQDARERAISRGARVVKQWDATMDGATREAHRRLDGQIVEVKEPFTYGTLTAMYPGDFGDPAQDCNCRCKATQRATWMLDEEELQTMKERAEAFGLGQDEAKKQQFADYEKKYLKAAEAAAPPMTKEETEAYLKKFLKDKNQIVTSTPLSIGGVDVTVSKSLFGFDDGYGGIKNIEEAVIYKTSEGTRFVFPKTYNKKQQTMTPEQALANWARVPQSIKQRAQKTVQFVDYYNPADTFYRKNYKNFKHSYATGGKQITFYRWDFPHDNNYVVQTYCHEAGHYIDATLPGASKANRYSSQAEWQLAMAKDFITSGKKSWRAYGENAAVEDFADSCAHYVLDHDLFVATFPERAKLLDKILK